MDCTLYRKALLWAFNTTMMSLTSLKNFVVNAMSYEEKLMIPTILRFGKRERDVVNDNELNPIASDLGGGERKIA